MKRRLTYIFFLLMLTSRIYSQQTFYVCTNNNGIILEDQNCSYQVICDSLGISMEDIAITPNQNIYITDGTSIYRLNIPDCTYTVIMDSLPNGAGMTSLVALGNDLLFTVTGYAVLYKISTINGAYLAIDTVKTQVSKDSTTYWPTDGDLTWYNNNIYLTSNNYLIEVVLNNNLDQISSVNIIGHMNSIPPSSILGLCTVSDCQSTKILGCEGSGILYSVSPQNASLQMLCNSFPFGIYGAATATNVSDDSIVFEVPNVFTPNNDNINDFFQPVNQNNIDNVELSIYNRWGTLIYSEKGTTFMWNGKYNDNTFCTEGVYFYLITVSNTCDKTETLKGFVQLIR